MKRWMRNVEPWMFGMTVTIDGREIQGEVGRFSLRGRIRMRIREMLGKPGWQMLPLADEEPTQ